MLTQVRPSNTPTTLEWNSHIPWGWKRQFFTQHIPQVMSVYSHLNMLRVLQNALEMPLETAE